MYEKVETKLLIDADRNTILNGLDWLRSKATKRDVTMLLYAGYTYKNNHFLLPSGTKEDDIEGTTISLETVKTVFDQLPGTRIAFLDTCYDDNFPWKNGGISSFNHAKKVKLSLQVVLIMNTPMKSMN